MNDRKHSLFLVTIATLLFLVHPSALEIATPIDESGCCCGFLSMLQLLRFFRRNHHGSALFATPPWGWWGFTSSPKTAKKGSAALLYYLNFCSCDIAGWYDMTWFDDFAKQQIVCTDYTFSIIFLQNFQKKVAVFVRQAINYSFLTSWNNFSWSYN